MTTEAPPRKRSNSLPMPKIEVTTCRGQSNLGSSSGDQKKLGSDLSSDHTSVKRSSSMSTSLQHRKKSISQAENSIHRDHHHNTGFKTFKTFVQSKILSKSDRSLASNANTTTADGSNPSDEAKKHNGQALSAKDHFMRRSSRTSFTEIDLVRQLLIQFLVHFEPFWV